MALHLILKIKEFHYWRNILKKLLQETVKLIGQDHDRIIDFIQLFSSGLAEKSSQKK